MELTEEKVQRAMDKMPFKSPYTAEEWLKHLYLENYHCHKDFSNICMTDSAESIENYAKRIKEYGSGQCLYSGEHGSQGNQFHVYKVAEQYGLKYRHSAEAYWVKDRHEKDRANCHIMIVAKNAEGRKDLNYILSMANIDGYYYKPRIDLELLLSVNPDNFIVTSACIGFWKYEDSEQIVLKLAEHFGKNFFLEIQYHNTQKQKDLNKRIIDIAQRYDLPLICGLDSHWVLEENRLKRDYMQKDKEIEFNPDEDGWYMDYPNTQTVIQRLEEQGVLTEEQILESILNTNVFVNECEEIVFDRHFKIPNIYKDLDYEGRVKLFKQKINKKYHDDPYKSKEKIEGIKWEVEQLAESGVVDYPLVSEAIVRRAVDQYSGVITRTARGSASSYLTNNYMGLTTIDRFTSEVPLFPERFLTKDRVLAKTLPDVDQNISAQEPFVQAAKDLLGEHGCYPLMTLQTYKEKSAWLMYARVNDVPAGESAALSKDLDKFNKAIKYADEDEIEYIHVEDYISPDYLELYKKSIPYQGITINVGVHACGHLIFDGDIRQEIGLVTAKSETTGNRTLVAAVEGKYLDEFGYVKEDLLIVDAVSLTKELFDSIGQEVPTFEELKKMVAGDQLTWDIYRKGITCCVNQVEKASTTQKTMRYCPRNIAELCALIASIRPGFASLINNFLERKPYTTGEEKIDKILEPSSHYMLYQESIMAVLSFLGMPMTETYSVIKAISKKKLKGEKKEKLLKELQEAWFKEFGNMDNFNKVWKVIEDAASYSFNASHAYAMAGDSLYLAWFKARHTAKFYETAITHYQNKADKDKINALMKEAGKFYGFKAGSYQFGADNRRVNVDEENLIIYPNLSAVKGFGEKIVEQIYEASQGTFDDFGSVYTAMKTTTANTTQFEDLARLGYFNAYGNENQVLAWIRLHTFFSKVNKSITKKRLEEKNIPLAYVIPYGRETKSMIKDLNKEELIKDLADQIEMPEPSNYQRMYWQWRIMGIADKTYGDFPKRDMLVVDVEIKKGLTLATLYSPLKGKSQILKLFTWYYKKHEFVPGDFLTVTECKNEIIQVPSGRLKANGKPEYVPVETGETEPWLYKYKVINDSIGLVKDKEKKNHENNQD